MDLKITDVAELLNVSQNRVEQWLKAGQIPSYTIKGQHRFSREEVEAWMIEQHGMVETEPKEGIHRFSLFRALHKGDLYANVAGSTPQEVIANTTAKLAEKFDLDPTGLTNLLLDREALNPTAIGNGIAVPHTRDFLLPTHYDVVTLVFPTEPIDYAALDGQKVHSLFFLFACDDKRHLDLLSKIAHFCNDERNLRLLERRPDKKLLLGHIKAWESGLVNHPNP